MILFNQYLEEEGDKKGISPKVNVIVRLGFELAY